MSLCERIKKKAFLNLTVLEVQRSYLCRQIEKWRKKGLNKYKKQWEEAMQELDLFDKKRWLDLDDVLAVLEEAEK